MPVPISQQPVPNTIAALKNHHKYVLGKKLLKFEALRPGAKAAGLVKGSKVYLKTDVATLRGASRWKKDALQVRLISHVFCFVLLGPGLLCDLVSCGIFIFILVDVSSGIQV